MYLFKENRLDLLIEVHSFKGTAEEKALVNSGAMENFINYETVKHLQLGIKKLDKPILICNIDGTNNLAGHIMHYLELLIIWGNKKIPFHFYITNLGSDWLILGYPWLRDFNL